METAELDIKIRDGHVVITKNDEIEFNDISVLNTDEMEYIIQEARAFKEYRKLRITERIVNIKREEQGE